MLAFIPPLYIHVENITGGCQLSKDSFLTKICSNFPVCPEASLRLTYKNTFRTLERNTPTEYQSNYCDCSTHPAGQGSGDLALCHTSGSAVSPGHWGHQDLSGQRKQRCIGAPLRHYTAGSRFTWRLQLDYFYPSKL